MAGKYDALFQPVRISNVEIKNRIGMAAMGTNSDDKDGVLLDFSIDYYEERAKRAGWSVAKCI